MGAQVVPPIKGRDSLPGRVLTGGVPDVGVHRRLPEAASHPCQGRRYLLPTESCTLL